MSTKGNRKGSSWRRKLYAQVSHRDGKICAKCGVAHCTIWRQQGSGFSQLSSEYPHTLVYPTSNLELDHRVPLHRGGSNDADNLWLLCRSCHRSKTTSEHSSRLKTLFAEARA